MCVCRGVYLLTQEWVWLCNAHRQHLSPRTPEVYGGMVAIFPLGVGGVWMVEGDDGELLYSINTSKMEEVELHSADTIKQLYRERMNQWNTSARWDKL